MDQQVNDIRISQWAAIVLEANNSGTSKKKWCEEHGIRLRKLYYWQRKLRRKEAERIGNAMMVPAEPAFAELKVPAAKAIQPQSGGTQISAPELVLETDRCRLLIGSSIREETLRTVMKVILDA